MITIGQIGAGFMGNTHSAAYGILTQMLDIKVAAICDIREDVASAMAAKHGAKVYTDADEMIRDPEIDVIDICLPTYLHARYARAAMEAGKDLFIEKPVVFRPQEGDMLLEVQQKTGAKVQVGQCIRLWPAYIYLKEVYEAKRFGKLQHLALRRLSPLPTWGWEDWYLQYADKSGGAALDLHIHDLDYMRYLLGEPQTVAVTGDRGQVYGLYTYPGGVSVQVEGGWEYPASYPFGMYYKAKFDDATVVYENSRVIVYPKEGEAYPVEVEDPEVAKSAGDFGGNLSELGGYFNELKYFYECLLQGKEISVAPLSEGVQSVKLVYRVAELAGF